MRFHSLNRLSFNLSSNCSIVTPSAPAAPPLLFTFTHASQISRLGMSCVLPSNLGSLMRLIPFRLVSCISPNSPTPWLHPHYRASQLLRASPPACLSTGTQPLAVSAAWSSPSRRQPRL